MFSFNQTIDPPTPATANALAEYADAKGVKQLFGLSRSHLYQLKDEGKILSVCLRRRGAVRGRRLFNCDSIRRYLAANIDVQGAGHLNPHHGGSQ